MRNRHFYSLSLALLILLLSGCDKNIGIGPDPADPKKGGGEQPLPPDRFLDETYLLPAGKIGRFGPSYPEGAIKVQPILIEPGRGSVLPNGGAAKLTLSIEATPDLPDPLGQGYRAFTDACDEFGSNTNPRWFSANIGSESIFPGGKIGVAKAVPVEEFMEIPANVPAIQIFFQNPRGDGPLDSQNKKISIIIPINWHRSSPK